MHYETCPKSILIWYKLTTENSNRCNISKGFKIVTKVCFNLLEFLLYVRDIFFWGKIGGIFLGNSMPGPCLGGKSYTSINIKQNTRLQIAPVQQPFKKFIYIAWFHSTSHRLSTYRKGNVSWIIVKPLNDSMSFISKNYMPRGQKSWTSSRLVFVSIFHDIFLVKVRLR